MANQPNEPFKPALIVVDMQEDFCPPNGSLAVTDGRAVSPVINSLLALPFTLKIATQDWHPQDHISFAANHPPPHNKPFESTITIRNPDNPSETDTSRLWPVHCVAGTPGAEVIPELDRHRVNYYVRKGQDSRVEMYSAFRDPFKSPCVARSGLSELMKGPGITHAYVVGLAADYCVKFTALHAAEDGYVTYVVEDATKAVDQSRDALTDLRVELEDRGVKLITSSSQEVKRVSDRK